MLKSLSLSFLLALSLGACSSSSDDHADASANADDAAAPSGSRIYASIAGDHEVLVIDEASHEVLSHIGVGKGPAILLATPDEKKLYTANWADDTVSAIVIESEEVTSIALPGRPYVIATSPDGKYVYAGLNSNQIAVISTASDEVERFMDTPELPASVIVSPDGKTLYVATLAGSIRAVSVANGDIVHDPIKVGSVPAWITMSPDGSKVFTLNFVSDNVSVVDTASWKVVKTIPTGAGSRGIIGAVTPDGSTIYVTNHGTGDVIAIDTTSYEITQTLPVDGRPVGVIFNADASRVYVADFGHESLDKPADMTYLLTGKLTITSDGQLNVFDTRTGKLVGKKIPVGPGPTSLVVLP